MQFNVLTLFPDFFKAPFEQGVLARALKNQFIQCRVISIRDFSANGFQSVDDRPFGGGEGMVLSYSPLESALSSIKEKGEVLHLSPQGVVWDHQKAKKYSKKKNLTLVCGRYSGIDARWLNRYVDEEISIGDYVLSGGELPALAVMDSISRFIEGVLGDRSSADSDSYEKSFLLKHPQWTRPRSIEGYRIPEIFFSGFHKEIEKARLYLSILITYKKRPDLLEKSFFRKLLRNAQEWQKTLSLEEKKACQLEEEKTN